MRSTGERQNFQKAASFGFLAQTTLPCSSWGGCQRNTHPASRMRWLQGGPAQPSVVEQGPGERGSQTVSKQRCGTRRKWRAQSYLSETGVLSFCVGSAGKPPLATRVFDQQ